MTPTIARLRTGRKAPPGIRFRGEPLALAGGVASALWGFGGGSASDRLEVQHVYQHPGVYLATLTVRSDLDSVARAQVVITVGEPTEPGGNG